MGTPGEGVGSQGGLNAIGGEPVGSAPFFFGERS